MKNFNTLKLYIRLLYMSIFKYLTTILKYLTHKKRIPYFEDILLFPICIFAFYCIK